MATRSRIGILNSNGTVNSIYCHWDGYLIYNGQRLLDHWQDEAKVRELMALGDIRSLGNCIGKPPEGLADEMPGWCEAYGLDTGQAGQECRLHTNVAAFVDPSHWEEFFYLFDAGTWMVSSGGAWHTVLDAIALEQAKMAEEDEEVEEA